MQCVVPEIIHTRTPPTEGIGISWEQEVLKDQSIEFNWKFQRGVGVLIKIPSVGEVWIFFGTTQCSLKLADIISQTCFKDGSRVLCSFLLTTDRCFVVNKNCFIQFKF